MASVKVYKTEELRKMSAEDRKELLGQTVAELATVNLKIKTNEDKQSHKISQLKKQAARINTLNNQPTKDEK